MMPCPLLSRMVLPAIGACEESRISAPDNL